MQTLASSSKVPQGNHSVQGVTQSPRAAWLSPVSSMLLLLLLLPLHWKGSLSQRLEVQPSVTVEEGMCAHVPCTFNTYGLYVNYNKSIYGYWFRASSDVVRDRPVATNDLLWKVAHGAQGRFHLTGDPRMKSCSLSITDAQFSDRGRYFFRIDYESDLKQKPDISMPEVLESGNPVTLKCTFPSACGQDRPFTFSWIGASLFSKTQSSRTSPSSQFSFISGPQHHGTNLTCQVTPPGGHLSTKKTVQLNVSSSVASCANASQLSEDGVLHLDLSHLGPADGGNYTYLAQHPLGSKQASLSISVNCECDINQVCALGQQQPECEGGQGLQHHYQL
ncbi:sialic acid-binding Ig-like lectin 9 [Notamacropus eugenii]|uniref:sialic acid-binding Ig-like lectin 9 n=1 Tax=Notamacropus eugenii TaxID=9315 RepID=UPI003B66D44E